MYTDSSRLLNIIHILHLYNRTYSANIVNLVYYYFSNDSDSQYYAPHIISKNPILHVIAYLSAQVMKSSPQVYHSFHE